MSALPNSIQAYGVELRRLMRDDIELVRQWRNHPEVSRHMLSNEPISREQQAAWFERINSVDDRAYYLAYYKGEPTAFASVTGEPGRRLADNADLEAAIYLAPDSRCRGTLLAFAPALALNDACFASLPCARLTARVKIENDAALRFNRQMGYTESGRDEHLVYLRLDRADYQAASRQIKQLLGRSRQQATHCDQHSDITP